MDARVLILMWFTMAIIRQGVNSNKDACNKFNSTCCYNYYFDERKDICVECKPGTFGWNCKEDCVSGYYGYLCQNECKCEEQHCDSATGCTKTVHDYSTSGENYPYHYRNNHWIQISFLLIGSLTTIFCVGIIFYIKTTGRCKTSSIYHGQGGDVNQQEDGEDPADTTLAEEEQPDDYAETRYSQFDDYSSTSRQFDNSACRGDGTGNFGIRNQTKQNVYDRSDNDCEYSRLQLRKKHSRIISQDGTQKRGYLDQNEEMYVTLKPSDITNSPLTKGNTLPPRIRRVDIGNGEQGRECSDNIIRCASESRLLDFQKDSPKHVTGKEVYMTREIKRDDTMIEIEDRPYSLVKL